MWSLLKLLVLLGFVAVGMAFLTKPEQQDAEAALKEQLLEALERKEIGGGNLALAACKLQPQSCYDLVRTGIDATFTDHTLYTSYSISGFGKAANCLGAFATFVCPGGLSDE